MAQDEAFRRRKLNFNEEETEILIREVTLNQGQLFGRGDIKTPPGAKNKIWHSILARVNAVSKCTRDIGDIKKRWYDMCHRTKDKVIRLAREAMQDDPPQQEPGLQTAAGYDDAACPSTSNDSEPSTSGASWDGGTRTAVGSRRRKPGPPSKETWQAKRVPVQLLPDRAVQWSPVLLFTVGQNASEESKLESQGRQANADIHETVVEVKREDLGSGIDVDYSSPETGSPPVSREGSPLLLQRKRLYKQISKEELLGVQEQHNILQGIGNEELHGIRQELRELRGDIEALATTIRQPLNRLADCMQTLLPLLQHPPPSQTSETTDSFTQHDDEDTSETNELKSHGCRTGRKRAKLNV
ncbi:uncharacterized protein LOC144603788 [Rhinoraja longicauda]